MKFTGYELIVIAFVVIILVAECMAISLFIKSAKAKGYDGGTGALWFIGICAPLGWIAVGIYASSLPSKNASAFPAAQAPARDELPSI